MKTFTLLFSLPLTLAFGAAFNGEIPPGYISAQAHQETMPEKFCNVTLYEDKQDKTKYVAVVQEQVEYNDEAAYDALKSSLAKRENLPKNGEATAFNVNCQ